MSEKDKTNYLACVVALMVAMIIGIVVKSNYSEPKLTKAEKDVRFFLYNTDNIYGSGIR